MKVYLAGPMTGYPEHNFPVFFSAALALRNLGYEVVSPAEQDYNNDKTLPWAFYMRRDVPLLCQCDAIVLLPGWDSSRGATLEKHIAEEFGMEKMYLHTLDDGGWSVVLSDEPFPASALLSTELAPA